MIPTKDSSHWKYAEELSTLVDPTEEEIEALRQKYNLGPFNNLV